MELPDVAWHVRPSAAASKAPPIQALRREAETLLADHRLRSAKELRHHHAHLKALDLALRSEEFGQTLQAGDPLLTRLQHRITHTETLLRSSSFNVCRTLEERALQWDAAAGVLRAQIAALEGAPRETPAAAGAVAKLDSYQRLCEGQAQALRDAARAQEQADPLAIVDDTARAAKPAKPKRWGRVDPAFRAHVGALLGTRPGQSIDAAGRSGAGVAPADALPWSEQVVALKCLERAFKETEAARRAAGVPSGPPVKQQFKTSLTDVLSRREQPVIQTTLFLTVPDSPSAVPSGRSDTKSVLPGEREIQCRQTSASHLSVEMHRRYHRDGLVRAVCHDDTQHQHATSLYRSEMRDAKSDQSMLTLTRHGAVGAFGLTPRGIQTLTDERLGRIALDLAPQCGDPRLETYARGKTVAGLHDHKDPAMRAREAGAYVRRLVSTEAGVHLLAEMRREASRRRAAEVAEAAMCGLPSAELVRIRTEINAGRVPTVRLTSVALLTPDALRHDTRLAKYTSDERQMWLDQRDAWKALELDSHIEMQVPSVDREGRVLRDSQGRIATSLCPVKVEVAAFDLPVNKGGVGPGSSLDAVSGRDLIAPDNQAALRKLLGPLPGLGSLHRWTPEPPSWIGTALRGLSATDPKREPILELSRQVARLVVEGRHLSRADDPYILVRRLLVLCHLTGIVAPAVNCRSGKDRTTEAETQARRLAFEIATTGKVPLLDPDCVEWHPPEVEPQRQKLLSDLSLGGGSHDVQDETAGVSGIKLTQDALRQQHGTAGDPELQRDYNGKSKLTGT